MSIDPTDPKNDDPQDDDLGFGAFGGSDNTGFDYAAFEESIADADEEEDDQLTDPGMVEEQVESRPTIDLRRVPQDDATYDIRELGKYTVVTIRGRVNESFPGEAIGNKLRGAVVFDLTEVDRITSFGVRAWLQMLDLAKMREAVFVRASPAVVNQVTMMRNFCGPARIHSLVAPYACENCGNEFGVTYEAVADKTALRARNPLTIECPECRNGAELDEDPWVFFGIDEQLLEEIPDELGKVLENLGDRPNHAPIEKAIVDDTTRVRFNGMVDGSTRLQRAFSGLEGKIVVDLRTATGVDDAGIAGLANHFGRLDPAITAVDIEGCPVGLLEKLLASPQEVIKVRSVVAQVFSEQRNLSRPVVIDIRRHRQTLSEGRIPDLDIPWRDEPIRLEGMEHVQKLAQLTSEEKTKAATPVPVAPPTDGATSGAAKGGAIASVVVLAAAGALLLVVLLVGMFFFMQGPGTPDESVVKTPDVAAPVAASKDGEWSTGGLLPPDWSERAVVEEGDVLKLAGIGNGAAVTDALEEARKVALGRLLANAEKTIATHHASDALAPEGPARQEAIARWNNAASSLPLKREQDASRRTSDGRYEVAAQYVITKTELDAFLETFGKTAAFRGLTFASRPPWAEPGLRVVERASYISSGESGDLLKTIGGKSVTSLEQFEETANPAYERLAPGATLMMVLDRDGNEVNVAFPKRRAETPAPPALDGVPQLNLKNP